MNWRIVLPVSMLLLAALACSYQITLPGIVSIEADPNQAGVIYIQIQTVIITNDLPSQPTVPQYFEVSDYGSTWRSTTHTIINNNSDEYAIFMDDHHTLYIDNEPVWVYPPYAGESAPLLPWDNNSIQIGARPNPADYYGGQWWKWPRYAEQPLPLDYAISPADPDTIFIGLLNLGVLVGPAPNSNSDRAWELHVLKANMQGEIDTANSGGGPLPISNRTLGLLFWSLMMLHGLLPAIAMYAWFHVIHRQHELAWKGSWWIWITTLILASAGLVLWVRLAYPHGIGPDGFIGLLFVIGCILSIAVLTGISIYRRAQEAASIQQNTENPAE